MGDDFTVRDVWTTKQLTAAGHSYRDIARAVDQQALIKIAKGHYISKKDPHSVFHAFNLAYPGLTFTGWTAAYLYGVAQMVWPATAHHPKSRSAVVHLDLRRRAERPTVTRRGLQVAVAAIVAAELATQDESAALRVLEIGYQGFTGSRRLEDDYAHLTRGERRRLDPIVRKAVIGTASKLEEKAVRLIRKALADEIAAGLVTIETNAMVRGYCFDIMIREVRVLIEIDSWAYHGEAKSKRMDFARDRCKGNQATRWGYLLLRYPDSAVKHTPHYVSDEVADTVRFELRRLRRLRQEEEAIPTDAPMWLWFPKV